MGSEILDSGGWVGALATPAPQAPLAPALEFDVAPVRRGGGHHPLRVPPGRRGHVSVVAERDHPEPADPPSGAIANHEAAEPAPDDPETGSDDPGPVRLREVAAGAIRATRRVATDPVRRRTATRVVAVCLSLMIVTGWAVHAHDQRILATRTASALDVDIRLAQVPADSSTGDGQLPALEGSASAEVQLHNVGPLPIHLLGLDVLAGFQETLSYPVLRTDTTVAPGDQLDQSYHVMLPCGINRGAAAAGSMTAQIRTSDGVVHTVPVDLTAVNDSGGLLGACLYYEFRQGQFHGFGS